jgi:hypothetical protein
VVLLHRQSLTTGSSRVDVIRGYRQQWTYRSFVTRERLVELAAVQGRRITFEVAVGPDVSSFILER